MPVLQHWGTDGRIPVQAQQGQTSEIFSNLKIKRRGGARDVTVWGAVNNNEPLLLRNGKYKVDDSSMETRVGSF